MSSKKTTETSPLAETPGFLPSGELAPEVERDRRRFWDYVTAHAVPRYREVMGRIYGEMEEWRKRFFPELAVAPYLLIAQPPNPRADACYCIVTSFGGISEVRIRPSIVEGKHRTVRPGPEFAEGRFRYVLDLVLHECVHLYNDEVKKIPEDGYHGHGPAFRDLCNAIGEQLGLGPVRCGKKRGVDSHLASAAQWPVNVRPHDYYLGAVRKVAEKIKRPSMSEILSRLRVSLAALDDGKHVEARREVVTLIHLLE